MDDQSELSPAAVEALKRHKPIYSCVDLHEIACELWATAQARHDMGFGHTISLMECVLRKYMCEKSHE